MPRKNLTKKIILFTVPLLPIIGISVWASTYFVSKDTSKTSAETKQAKRLNENKNNEKNDLNKKENTVKVEEVDKPKNDSNDDQNTPIISRIQKSLPKINDIETTPFIISNNEKEKNEDSSTSKPSTNDAANKEKTEDPVSSKPSTNNAVNEEKPNKEIDKTTDSNSEEDKKEKEEKINEIKDKANNWIQNQLISYFHLTSNQLNNTFKDNLQTIIQKLEEKLDLDNKPLEEIKNEDKIKGEIENLIKDNVEVTKEQGSLDESNYKDYVKTTEVGKRKQSNFYQPDIVFNKNLNSNNYWYVEKQDSDVSLTFDILDKNNNSLFVKEIEIIVNDKNKTEYVNSSKFNEYFYVNITKNDGTTKRMDLTAPTEGDAQFLDSKETVHIYNRFRVNVNEEIKSFSIVFPKDLQPSFPSIYQVKINSDFVSNIAWKDKKSTEN